MSLTPQEIFDRVATHLLTQRKAAKTLKKNPDDTDDEEIVCMYRAPDGLKCAVGCLIPDELYEPALENKGVSHETVRAALFDAGVLDEDDADPDKDMDIYIPSRSFRVSLLMALQEIHDREDPADWRGDLIILARQRGLSHEVLNHFPTENT